YYDWRETKFAEGSHAYVHPRIAYQNAQKLTTISKLEKDIIIKHMWGATIAPPRYKESFVVTFVDDYVAIKEWTQLMKMKWKHHKLFKKEKLS
ncbi:MAG: HAD family hydrolase, partial [Lactococcus sp.]|nr:HAD family hydrolase [Lactococcus sp.]